MKTTPLLLPLAVFAVACTASPSTEVVDVAATWQAGSSLPTSGLVSWDEDLGAVSVEYGPTTDYGDAAPQTGPTSALLLGLTPDTTFHYHLFGDGWESTDATFQTASAPGDLAGMSLVTSDGSRWGRYVLTATFTPDYPGGVEILDTQLRPVWWAQARGFVWSAQRALDGQSVLYLEGDGGADADIVRVALTGEELDRYPAPYAHHAFVQLPGGDVAYIASTVRSWNGIDVVGDQIVVLAPDGSTRVLWDAFDDLTPVEQDHWSSTLNPLGADWTHANGLAYDTDSNSFLLSSYYLRAVYRIDAATGDIQWQLGGDGSDFTFPDDHGFGPQHSPQFTDDGVLLFDNDEPSVGSRVVQYALDQTTNEAARVAEAANPAGGWTATFSYAARLPSGQLATTWGERGEAAVIDESGEVAWEINADPGSMLFGLEVFDSFYP